MPAMCCYAYKRTEYQPCAAIHMHASTHLEQAKGGGAQEVEVLVGCLDAGAVPEPVHQQAADHAAGGDDDVVAAGAGREHDVVDDGGGDVVALEGLEDAPAGGRREMGGREVFITVCVGSLGIGVGSLEVCMVCARYCDSQRRACAGNMIVGDASVIRVNIVMSV